MDHTFRNAMFGGFNRQDVLTYLENAAKEAAQQQEELQQQLEELRNSMTRQGEELAGRQSQVEQLQQENAALRAQLEQANAALSASRVQCAQQESTMNLLRRDEETLRARVAALEPDASAYVAVKDRTAGVELEAHRRAQAVQDESEEQARQLRRQMMQWMQKVEREYDALRSEVEATVGRAAEQLAKAGESLEQMTVLLDEQDLSLETLEKFCADDDAHQAEAVPSDQTPDQENV